MRSKIRFCLLAQQNSPSLTGAAINQVGKLHNSFRHAVVSIAGLAFFHLLLGYTPPCLNDGFDLEGSELSLLNFVAESGEPTNNERLEEKEHWEGEDILIFSTPDGDIRLEIDDSSLIFAPVAAEEDR